MISDTFIMEELCMEGGALRSLLENKDLLTMQPRAKGDAKEEKDNGDVYSDATAAFLGPNIWDKTLTDFKLEYLDLDALVGHNSSAEATQKVHTNGHRPNFEAIPNLLQPNVSQERQNMNVDMPGTDSCSRTHSLLNHLPTVTPPLSPIRMPTGGLQEDTGDLHIFNLDCKFASKELALATSPGENNFNPASVSLQDDDLKPQPMVRKSEKHFVPDSLKDDRYWARRRKNNLAAKRSREARRVKENQIVLRASYLEKENNTLKDDVMRLRSENDMLRNQLKKLSGSFPI